MSPAECPPAPARQPAASGPPFRPPCRWSRRTRAFVCGIGHAAERLLPGSRRSVRRASLPPCLPPRDRGACQPVGGRVPCVPGWCPVFSSRRRERLCRHPRVDGTSCPLGRCRPGARPPGAGVAARPVVRTCQALPPWRARAPQGSPRLPPPLPERSACPCPRGRPLPSRGWCRCAAA